QDNGNYSMLAGNFTTTTGPYTFGTYLWAKFDDLPKWERKLVEGPYIHHMAEIEGDYSQELREFCKYVPGLTLDTVERSHARKKRRTLPMSLVNLQDVLAIAEKKCCAIPAFNVYNLETIMGVAQAAEEMHTAVIFQVYSRLFDSDNGRLLAPCIREAIAGLSVPAAFHLDHGAGTLEVQRALRYGATGIMIDASALPLEENIALTRRTATECGYLGVPVEGELGHVGTTRDSAMGEYTKVDEAKMYAAQTGVAALAILVGTAHGRYRQAPKLDIDRIAAIRAATDMPLVLHGGSGVPDDQIRAAIAAGIRKINFGTDLCYAFLDGVFGVSRDIVAIDLFMKDPIAAVRAFAMEKIELLGAKNSNG
ncbi:MAG: class II fructose-bisphosphate aldolase, partial [Clostridia bacterium]